MESVSLSKKSFEKKKRKEKNERREKMNVPFDRTDRYIASKRGREWKIGSREQRDFISVQAHRTPRIDESVIYLFKKRWCNVASRISFSHSLSLFLSPRQTVAS